MARRIVSVLRCGPAALRGNAPALEANAYAVAEDVDLVLVLRGAAVELAVAGADARAGDLAGVALPPAAGVADLRGLVESGVRVLADAGDLAVAGLGRDDLVAGVEAADAEVLAATLRGADAVVTW